MHIATHPLTRASTFKHRPDTLIFAIFVTLLFLAPIPAGANREWGWAILLSCYALILIVQLTRNQYKISNEESCATTHRILIYSLLAVLAWQIIQVIPGLDLRTSEAADTSLNSLSRISNDPYSTFQSILKNSLYIITFVLALTFITRQIDFAFFAWPLLPPDCFKPLMVASHYLPTITTGTPATTPIPSCTAGEHSSIKIIWRAFSNFPSRFA